MAEDVPHGVELSPAEKAWIAETVDQIVGQAKGPLVTVNKHYPRGFNAFAHGFLLAWGAATFIGLVVLSSNILEWIKS
ncbi:hypothetical protein IP68_12265 [Blastomonas sp. AAP25]|uniref:hypothetical protein n=1 Tax=Blastomonas sp. AAP25 TaxID=1523416 RepID=UPI0006B8E61F|nr:hypothetical protein [Blastomonas sp. AAP25]KPF74538.1 hypothetical protein IP68_12265 [Blastomonas sp. AAP25]